MALCAVSLSRLGAAAGRLLGVCVLHADGRLVPHTHAAPPHTRALVRCAGRLGYDPEASGSPATWDTFGIWDNCIEEPILLPQSIRYGTPNPNINLVGSASVIGQRRENEDRLRVAAVTNSVLYFAVFDGHGGAHAADFCYKHMEHYIRDGLEQQQNLELVLSEAFLRVDKALRRHLHFFGNASLLTAGTTATVALLRDGIELVVGSVGDSRALISRNGKALKLTTDHTPERRDERHRIRECGGFVTWNSLGQANVNGRLAMTRSIGDFHLKTSGVIAEPETKRIMLHHAHDSFLALTTDGINFLMTNQEICDVINQCHDPMEAAHLISEQALQYGSDDNSTVVVVPFGAWGKQQCPQHSYSISRTFASTGRWA